MPIIMNILYNCSIVLLPSNRGTPRHISAKTHPALHISIAYVLTWFPLNIIYGALYHFDATYSVKTWSAILLCLNSLAILTSPKSHILASQDWFSKILEGLISLWINYDACKYWSPAKICIAIYFLWSS